jgi:hypothetical protein
VFQSTIATLTHEREAAVRDKAAAEVALEATFVRDGDRFGLDCVLFGMVFSQERQRMDAATIAELKDKLEKSAETVALLNSEVESIRQASESERQTLLSRIRDLEELPQRQVIDACTIFP